MPYIKGENRPPMDEIVDLMLEKGVNVNGDLNYLLFKFCKKAVKPSYNNYKNFIGELDCCAREIYRKLVAPYEDDKEMENGEVR